MIELSKTARDELAGVDFVLTDIDDTLTAEGRVSCAAYCALWSLHDAGIKVIPVTGRPAGWCDLIARQWPISGVVGENGAFVFAVEDGHMRHYYHPSVERETAMPRLRQIAERVYREVPGTREAKDQFARMFDIAVDFREEPPFLEYSEAEKIKLIFEEEGATAKVSSIHVNAWFGTYDKLAMTRLYFLEHLGIDVEDPGQNRRVLFCGDSPNDEPMFGFFRNACAVANIEPFIPTIQNLPRFITAASHGDGFAEAAARVLDARSAEFPRA